MNVRVRPVLFIPLVEVLEYDEFRKFIDFCNEIGSLQCDFQKDGAKHWGEGFSFLFYMETADGEVHHEYDGPGTLMFNSRDYDLRYKDLYDILIAAGLTQAQLFDEFVLDFSW